MSWQAHEAVDSHSKHTKISLFKLLHRLAGIADATGVINMAPAQSVIASWFGVSDRTVRNWLDELIQSGELIQTRIGSGPGNPSAYQINLPMPSGKVEKVEEIPGKVETKVEKVEEITAILSTFAAAIDELKAEIKSLKLSTFQNKGGKGGNERWKRWKRKVVTGSRGRVQTTHDQSIIQPVKELKTPPTPQGVGDGAEFQSSSLETEFWGKAQTLVSDWQGLIGDYRPLDANRRQDKTDFFAPALRIINDFGGDYAAAWQAVRAERERMIRDGMGNVRKLSAVITGVLAGLERARLPDLPPVHQGNGNGRKLSNAEAGAAEYAAMRATLVRSRQP